MKSALGAPIQGVTLYSFTRSFHRRDFTFAELVRKVAAAGLGPGLEIVGFQSIRNFPRITEEFVREFRALIDETGLVPTALGANADAGLRRDRRLTSDEMIEYMAAQVRAAATLGFPIVRAQFGIAPTDLEKLVPLAERLGVTIGVEMHAPHSLRHPVMAALLETFERVGSPRLGFIPDWGASMDRMPRTLLASYRQRGVDPDLVDEVDDFWNALHGEGGLTDDHAIHDNLLEMKQIIERRGAPELANEIAVNAAELFGHAHAAEWADVLPWAVHTHGKFYEIDETGEETAVPIRDIVRTYVENGYCKTISTEWEGFHWNRTDDPLEMVAKGQALVRRAAAAAGSSIVTDTDTARHLVAAHAASPTKEIRS